MLKLYDINGLPFWNSKEIRKRNYMKEVFADEIEAMLRAENRAWHFFEIEAPLLMPRDLMNPNYTNEDIWAQEGTKVNIEEKVNEDLVLRPETTPSSYAYACHMLNSNQILPPFCIHQTFINKNSNVFMPQIL